MTGDRRTPGVEPTNTGSPQQSATPSTEAGGGAEGGDDSANGGTPNPPPKFFDTIRKTFAELPTLTAASSVLLGVLALVGVTTDTLPRVALNAPIALAVGVAAPLLLLVGAVAWHFGKANKRWSKRRRIATGAAIGIPLAYLAFMGVWVSTQSSTPDVSVALTAMPDQAASTTEPVHFTYTATVVVDQIQADEVIGIWVWPSSRKDCANTTFPPSPDEPDGNILAQSESGVTSDGALSRTLEGHVILQPHEGLCAGALVPERCGWDIKTIDWCVIPRDERDAYAFAFPDSPPFPAAGSSSTLPQPAPGAPAADGLSDQARCDD